MSPAPQTLAQTVRAAAHRALAAREERVREAPEWDTWRLQARQCKAQAIDRLDELIARLQAHIEDWGGTVLFARDAAEARGHILQIARRHGVRRVVKSKSMTTEEIGLNPCLLAAGLEVAETDLGEFIIQLAGHPPAHLTAPALHLNRRQIAALFAEHLELDCPPDPMALCRVASRHLRDRFAAAHLGITGVNFAAAAEGTLVFLENEGNLRQSMAMPPVHVALMGLEKVIPGLADLEAFLRLLPASATGQRLTALVHFLNGLKPRPDGGSQSFYLILLDNGRRRLAAETDLQEALYCLRCGACLNICPVFQAGGAHLYGRVYPGAVGIILARYLAPTGDIADFCTQCGACRNVCPAAIELPEKILAVRRHSPQFRKMQTLSWGAGLILTRPRLYRGLEAALRLAARTFPGSAFRVLGTETPPESFHHRARKRGPLGQGRPDFIPLRPPHRVEPRRPAPPVSEPPPHRFREAGAGLHDIQGLQALARFLAELAGEAVLWLEDHALLGPLAQALGRQGVSAHVARDSWPPEAEVAVTVGRGAIPELGTVLLGPKAWPAAWLPFRARRHVVLVPPTQAALTIPAAVQLTLEQGPGLATWLTGPTRTADIEKVLVLGAQGPEALDVVLYTPDA